MALHINILMPLKTTQENSIMVQYAFLANLLHSDFFYLDKLSAGHVI